MTIFVLFMLIVIIISQGLIIGMVVRKLRKTKEDLAYAYSYEGQRKITMNTIKNRMWY